MYVLFLVILIEYNYRVLVVGYWLEENKCFYMVFIDFGKVFDGFNYDIFWNFFFYIDLIL